MCFLHQQSGGEAALGEDCDLHMQLGFAQTLLLLVYVAAAAWQLEGKAEKIITERSPGWKASLGRSLILLKAP